MESYNSAMTYARAERVLRRIDFDNDGTISFNEWHNFIRPFLSLGGRSYSPARISVTSNNNSLNNFIEPVRTSANPIEYSLRRSRSPLRDSLYSNSYSRPTFTSAQKSRSPIRNQSPRRTTEQYLNNAYVSTYVTP
jgi:hypothetical protein